MYVCVPHMCITCPCKSESIGTPGTGVTNGCQTPCGARHHGVELRSFPRTARAVSHQATSPTLLLNISPTDRGNVESRAFSPNLQPPSFYTHTGHHVTILPSREFSCGEVPEYTVFVILYHSDQRPIRSILQEEGSAGSQFESSVNPVRDGKVAKIDLVYDLWGRERKKRHTQREERDQNVWIV